MFKNVALLLILVVSFQSIDAQITLTHNIGTTPIKTDMFSCERDEGWSRVFKLSDFGIAENEQFIIKSGQVALSKSHDGARLQFAIYSIDANFPQFYYSSYPRTLLGVRGIGQTPIINGAPEIIQVDFEEPIIVPAGIERILVTVHKSVDFYNPASAQVFIAGTENDTGTSWYLGCEETYSLTPTTDLTTPVPNANFYINVTGEVFNAKSLGSTTRLSHNICDDLIETDIHSCTASHIYWARAFTLEDFGISTNEEFVINSGQVGINKTGWTAEISFNIYKIDNNFPASFSETDLIGSSQYQRLSPSIDRSSQIIEVDFDTPIVIPADVERILVEVHKGIVSGDGLAFIAGSEQDNDVSWQRGCINVAGGTTFGDEYVSTADFGRPNANFYINVTGNANHITNNFEMNISNICSEFLKEFSLENKANITSVIWDFGDSASGTNNTSTDLSPFHDFSADGIFTITATITANNGSIEVISETIDVKEPPNAYGITNVYACEDNFNSGISSSFDVSMVKQQVLGGQINKVVTFIDGSGNEYNSLPNPFTNTVRDIETITVRVSHKDNFCCSSETTFDLIINPIPNLESIEDLIVCDSETNGFALFNLQQVKENIIVNNTNTNVEFYHENGQIINEPLNAVENLIANEEVISVHAINTNTNCYNETIVKLKINPLPSANTLNELIGCDDNNDGISEYFDTSNVESTVIGNQTGLEISYYDSSGNLLQAPLPNPYTNSVPYQETLVVRVTNTTTGCYAETSLELRTSEKPEINQPEQLFACDEGNGYGVFDVSSIEAQLIGNQLGLTISYFDSDGNALPSPLPPSFKNTQAWNQTIFIRVENVFSNLCVSETTVDLVVQELPTIDLDQVYFLCDLEPSLSISVEPNLDVYEWRYEDGTVISTTFEAELIESGNYSLTIGEFINGIYCENIFDFEMLRSVIPRITDVRYQDLSDNNYIEIIASGGNELEHSIDGINYQDSNVFYQVPGGTYNVYVRDKKGCGEDSQEIFFLNYPKFFTPNNDMVNDYWQISGIENFPSASIHIFDRYGKLLKKLGPNSQGWDGTLNGTTLPSTDYWFAVDLRNGKSFKGHFSLKR